MKLWFQVHFADNQADSSPTSESGLGLSGLKIKVSPTDHITFINEGSEMSGSLSLTNADDKIISYKVCISIESTLLLRIFLVSD